MSLKVEELLRADYPAKPAATGGLRLSQPLRRHLEKVRGGQPRRDGAVAPLGAVEPMTDESRAVSNDSMSVA
ncbi:MAG: hypothetical protein AB7U73_17215 [Pirellulales bacterium]